MANLSDEERRDEFFRMRDGYFKRALAEDPTFTELELHKGLCLTLWDIIKQQGEAITTYLQETNGP